MVELQAIGGLLSGTVEVDETYVGGKKQGVGPGNKDHKTPVVSLVERQGRVRSFVVGVVTGNNLKTIIKQDVAKQSRIMTDQFSSYQGIGKHFESHDTVDHSKREWKRGNAHTNTVEAYFSLLKRGINGTFHHVTAQHLHRYLSEFDFRDNARMIEGIEGKRLTSKQLTSQPKRKARLWVRIRRKQGGRVWRGQLSEWFVSLEAALWRAKP